MDRTTQNILIILAILFLLYYRKGYGKKTMENGGTIAPPIPPPCVGVGCGTIVENGIHLNTKLFGYRCDAGGCLECSESHPICTSKSECEARCQSQIIVNSKPVITSVIGCMDKSQLNYDSSANVPCDKCCVPAIMGCNDPRALNYYSAVSSGWGCSGKNPNDTRCCVYQL